MDRSIVSLAIAVLVACQPHAAEAKSLSDRLTSLPTAEYGYVATRVADCGETQYILSKGKGYEANPFIGKHPSALKLWAFCAVTTAVHVGVISIVQDHDEHAAKVAATVSLVVGGGIAGANLRIVFR